MVTIERQFTIPELEERHVAILEQLLVQKLEALRGLPYQLGSAGEWELLALLNELGLIADELRRVGTSRERTDIPF